MLCLTKNIDRVFPMTEVNSSKALRPETIKNSVINKYSRQALSTKAYC